MVDEVGFRDEISVENADASLCACLDQTATIFVSSVCALGFHCTANVGNSASSRDAARSASIVTGVSIYRNIRAKEV